MCWKSFTLTSLLTALYFLFPTIYLLLPLTYLFVFSFLFFRFFFFVQPQILLTLEYPSVHKHDVDSGRSNPNKGCFRIYQ